MGIKDFIDYTKQRVVAGKPHFYLKELIGRKVLDMGCGGGRHILDKENWVGIDSSKECVDFCGERGIRAVLGSFLECPFPDASFDGIIAFQVIEHLQPSGAVAFFKEVARLLKSGGICYITTPVGRNVWGTVDHVRPYFPAAIEKLFAKDFAIHNLNVPEMKIDYVIYQAGHTILFPIANILPLFRSGYLMRIRKVGP